MRCLMKRLIFGVLFVSFVNSVSFALDCNSLLGSWSGTLGGLSNFRLMVSSVQNSYVSFKQSNGVGSGTSLTSGTCEKQADGTTFAVHLSGNPWGVHSELTATLKEVTEGKQTFFQLIVSPLSPFLFSDGIINVSGSGTLTKL